MNLLQGEIQIYLSCCVRLFLSFDFAAPCQLLVPHQWCFLGETRAEPSFPSMVQCSVVCCSVADSSYTYLLLSPVCVSPCVAGGESVLQSFSPLRLFSPLSLPSNFLTLNDFALIGFLFHSSHLQPFLLPLPLLSFSL